MRLSRASRWSIRSSPRRTAKGSSPTCRRAHSTAWPRPSGSPCRMWWMLASRAGSRTASSRMVSPLVARACSSSKAWSKWSSMARLWRPVTIRTSSSPAAAASSTTYWMAGLSTTGSISLGVAFVAGRKRVPRPAAGTTALRTRRVGAAGASGAEESEGWGALMRLMLTRGNESAPRGAWESAVEWEISWTNRPRVHTTRRSDRRRYRKPVRIPAVTYLNSPRFELGSSELLVTCESYVRK